MRHPSKRYSKGIKWPGPNKADKYPGDISPTEYWYMEEDRRVRLERLIDREAQDELDDR